jgi:hypothetical protein
MIYVRNVRNVDIRTVSYMVHAEVCLVKGREQTHPFLYATRRSRCVEAV